MAKPKRFREDGRLKETNILKKRLLTWGKTDRANNPKWIEIGVISTWDPINTNRSNSRHIIPTTLIIILTILDLIILIPTIIIITTVITQVRGSSMAKSYRSFHLLVNTYGYPASRFKGHHSLSYTATTRSSDLSSRSSKYRRQPRGN